jgi:ribosomal protein S27AE
MSQNGRYGIFKVMVTCPHCGNPMPVNGPQRQPICRSCQKEVGIAAETWSGILGDYLKDYKSLEPGSGNNSTIMGEITLKCTSVKLPPPDAACTKCETNWDLASVKDGTDGTIACKKCGYKSPTFPPPDWLKALVPAARQIFFGERDRSGTPEGVPDPNAAAAKPIALACPQCGGGLLITAQTERTLPCTYCKVDVFLPDAVWLKLHPAKEAKFWLVRFQ